MSYGGSLGVGNRSADDKVARGGSAVFEGAKKAEVLGRHVKVLDGHLKSYDATYRDSVQKLVECGKLSAKISRLEAVSKDLQEHQWKKVGLYVLAGAIIVISAVLTVLFFKVTLPYIMAHVAMGTAGDGLGILVASHVCATIGPLMFFPEIYHLLSMDGKEISRLKAEKEQLGSQIDRARLADVRQIFQQQKETYKNWEMDVTDQEALIAALDALCRDIDVDLSKSFAVNLY